MDRSSWSIDSLGDSDDREYWFAKSPEERLCAMELMRQINYDYDPLTSRLQRVFEIIER